MTGYRKEIDGLRAVAEEEACTRHGRFESPEVQRRVREADIVIIVGAWWEWQVPYVPDTIAAFKEMGARKLIIPGPKDFGDISPLRYLGMTDDARIRLRNEVTPKSLFTNAYLRTHLAPDVYVDVQQLVSDDERKSPVFTDDVKLISFDGDHLTKEGARLVGQKIFHHPLLAR